MTTIEVITSFSVSIAAASFAWGVFAWKREFIGKKRIELAQSVLALFYEAETAIQEIRSFYSFGEREVRDPAKNDREEQERIRLCESANLVFERYQKREKLFAELRSMKYQVMATFGKIHGKPFDEISEVLNKIFFAAQLLGTKYWPMQNLKSMRKVLCNMSDEKLKEHQKERERYEAIIWFSKEDGDEIVKTVRQSIKRMESVVESEVSAQASMTKKIGILFSKLKKNIQN